MFSKHNTPNKMNKLFLLLCLLAGLHAANTAPALAQGQPLTVQAAKQSNYTRLVLNLADNISHEATISGRVLTLSIDGLLDVDATSFNATGLAVVGGMASTQSNNRTILRFDVVPDIDLREFRSGGYLVMDLYGGDVSAGLRNAVVNSAASSQTSPTAQSAKGTADTAAARTGTNTLRGAKALGASGASEDILNPSKDSQTEQTDEEFSSPSSLTSNSNSDDDAEPIADDYNTPDADISNAPVNQRTDVDQNLRESVSAIEIGTISKIENADSTIKVQTRALEESIELDFLMPGTAAAAVFERGGSLWVVFDKPYQLDPSGLQSGGNEVFRRIRRIEQLPDQDALILRMNVRPNQFYIMEREENLWRIALKDTPAKPRFPLRPTRREEGQGQQVFVQAAEIGRKVEFEDPDIGDILVVMPTLRESNGVAQQYNYASAQLLETAQGIAVSPLSDNVQVERFRDGVTISSLGNNLLSGNTLARASGIGSNGGNAFSRLIDFEEWRIGPSWEYRRNKARLFYELSLASKDSANDVRWKVARYFLAHGRAAEALGFLEMMLLQDEALSKNSEFRAVRGVANFKQGRLQEAEQDLSIPELSAEQDAELWRALVAEALGKHKDALEFYRRGKDIMGTYDETDRVELLLAVVRAAIETDNLELAQEELAQISNLTPTSAQLSESVYQSARIAERHGHLDQAQIQYDDLTTTTERWISARARYSLTKFGLKSGDITAPQAIEQLERLRYAWRGDKFESVLLNDLAEIYLQEGQFETGLETLRQAVSYYPAVAREKGLSLKMGNVFKDLFLEGKADNLSPIEAIGLFYQFRELTPLGAEGDLMIRRLADRLVSVDLLDRAASLLDYQVKARTEGTARALIAANLSKIHILNREPDKALEIIRATREPRLPEDILSSRRHVEARALVEMSRYEEAEVLLENDRSADAEILRADIFWGAQDWTRLITTVRKLLGDGWRRNEAITSLQRLNLMRVAIAMSFTSDRAGLIELRRRYASQMQSGDFVMAFDLLTNDQELSGRELGAIATQIANVEKFQSFMRDYRSDFTGR